MNINEAKERLLEALSSPNAKHWAFGPAIQTLLNELEKEKGYASAYETEKWHYHGLAESEGERANRAEKALEAAEKRNAELETRGFSQAVADVLAERRRQITAEGWTPEHDDQHMHCEMAVAAACYIMADDDPRADVPELWPWPAEWWKPTNIRRDLVKAGALVIAEIERLDRAAGIGSGEYGDAYQGAREDLAIWKRRALEAEERTRQLEQINDHLVKEAQGEHRFGEPVIRESVPEEMTMADAIMEIDAKDADRWTGRIGFQKGWNALRAAMLQGSQPVSKREKVRREHAEWSEKTFGNVGPVGPLRHLAKEALEAADNPEDPLEWADMQFLLWDAQRRMGISDDFITRAMIEKLEINKMRQWPEPKDGEPRLHIKEPGNSPAIPDGYVLAPIKPTPEMLRAGFLAGESYPGGVYRDMLAAAPKPEIAPCTR